MGCNSGWKETDLAPSGLSTPTLDSAGRRYERNDDGSRELDTITAEI